MLGGKALFLSQQPSCTCSLGAGGLCGQKGKCVETHAGVCMDLCGCVQVHVDLGPNRQDRKEEQTLSNTKGCCASAQLWRNLEEQLRDMEHHLLLTYPSQKWRVNQQGEVYRAKREGLHLCESMPGVQKLKGLICILSLSLGWLGFTQSLAKFSLFLSLSRQSRLKTSY